MDPNLYRLDEINKIERGLNEKKTQTLCNDKKISLLAELLHWLPFDFSVLYVSF